MSLCSHVSAQISASFRLLIRIFLSASKDCQHVYVFIFRLKRFTWREHFACIGESHSRDHLHWLTPLARKARAPYRTPGQDHTSTQLRYYSPQFTDPVTTTDVERAFVHVMNRSALMPIRFCCQNDWNTVAATGGSVGALSICTEASRLTSMVT